MTMSSTSFRSIRRVTRWLVRFTVASIILEIVLIADTAYVALTGESLRLLESTARLSDNLTSILFAVIGIITYFGTIGQAKIFSLLGQKE